MEAGILLTLGIIVGFILSEVLHGKLRSDIAIIKADIQALKAK